MMLACHALSPGLTQGGCDYCYSLGGARGRAVHRAWLLSPSICRVVVGPGEQVVFQDSKGRRRTGVQVKGSFPSQSCPDKCCL